jgi:uncharacterized protein involved in exopolysaccharide biosynthesis
VAGERGFSIMRTRGFYYWTELAIRRRRTVLEVGAAAFCLILLGTLLWPPVYRSTAKILVQDSRAQYLVSSDLQPNTDRTALSLKPVSEEDLNSEVELLTSDYLVNQAIANLKPPPAFTGPAAALHDAVALTFNLPVLGYHLLHETPSLTPKDKWALDLERHLTSSPIKRSNVIEVNFRSHDPQWSQKFLTDLLNEYLDYHARISHDPQAERFFQRQANALKDKLYASEDALRAFQLQHGITDLPAQKQALVARLSDLQGQYQRTSTELAFAREQVTALENQMRSTPGRIDKETRSVQNLALQQLKPQVMQLKAERAELLARYQPTSQRIQQIDAKIAAAERILEHEDHLEVQERSSDLNPVWVTIDTNLQDARVKAASLEASLNTMNSQIQSGHAALDQMVNDAIEMGRLERQVATDRDTYLSYVRKGEEARTAQALNLNKILNVSIAQPPSLPLRPDFPKVWLNLIAGLMLGAMLGLGVAYLEEAQDERIFSAATIADVADIETIAILRNQVQS